MTHVYGILLIKGLSWLLNLDTKITTLAGKQEEAPCFKLCLFIQRHFTHFVVSVRKDNKGIRLETIKVGHWI